MRTFKGGSVRWNRRFPGTGKEMGSLFFFWTFLKCPFFKMRLLNFTKKMKTSFLHVDALNSKKIRQKLLAYFFIYFLENNLE